MLLKKLLMIGCLVHLPLLGYEEGSDCPYPDSQANYFHTYPSVSPYYTPQINATQTYPADYPPYPGIAYETSYTTVQIATAIIVSTAFFVIVGIALTNTPHRHHHRHHHHGKHSHHCH